MPPPLRPPLGPLAWLFPELACGQDDAPQLAAFCAALARLRSDADLRVSIEPGPRGHALAAVLRDHATAPWRQVPRVDATPATGSLEAALRDAAQTGQVCALHARDGGYEVSTATLAQAQTRRRDGCWLLAVPADAHGAALLAATAEQVARAPHAYAQAGLVPALLPAADRSAPPRSRLAPSWFGLGGGDAPDEAALRHYRALVAQLYPERCLELDGYDNLAVSGCDLYSLALRAAAGIDRPAVVPAPRAKIIAVCGIDGSGKSTHARALAEHLAARGLAVATVKIYRHGVFHATVTDFTRRTHGARNLHLWRTERLAKTFDSVKCYFSRVAALFADHDVVVCDRYVQTHFAAGAGRCHWDPFTRELLEVFPPADHVFFLDVPVATALARIGARDARTVDENPYMLGRYRAMLDAMCGPTMTRLDGAAPFEVNHARMTAHVDALLSKERDA